MPLFTKFLAYILPEQAKFYSFYLWNESTRARNYQISMEQAHDLFQQKQRNRTCARKDNLATQAHVL